MLLLTVRRIECANVCVRARMRVRQIEGMERGEQRKGAERGTPIVFGVEREKKALHVAIIETMSVINTKNREEKERQYKAISVCNDLNARERRMRFYL